MKPAFPVKMIQFELSNFSIPYIETSAATGENVQLAVNLLLHRVMQRLKRYMRDIRYNYEDEVGLITLTTQNMLPPLDWNY